jgi:hypothetical protein
LPFSIWCIIEIAATKPPAEGNCAAGVSNLKNATERYFAGCLMRR